MKRFFFLVGFLAMFAFNADAQSFVSKDEALVILKEHSQVLEKQGMQAQATANLTDVAAAQPATEAAIFDYLKVVLLPRVYDSVLRGNNVGASVNAAFDSLNFSQPERRNAVARTRAYYISLLTK